MKGSRCLPYLCFWSWRPSQMPRYHNMEMNLLSRFKLKLQVALWTEAVVSAHTHMSSTPHVFCVKQLKHWLKLWPIQNNVIIKRLLNKLSESIICECVNSKCGNGCVWDSLFSSCGQLCDDGECTKFFIFLCIGEIFIHRSLFNINCLEIVSCAFLQEAC